MKERQVTKEEYKQAFQKIYKAAEGLMYLIEHDSNLGYNGFLLKQKIRSQIVYPLEEIEERLDSEIEKEKYK